MKTPRLLVIGGVVVCGVLALVQTRGREPQHVPGTCYGAAPFALDGTNYAYYLARSNILAAPDWSPSKPLPLSISAAVAVAQDQVSKIVPAEKQFYLKEITLSCVGHTYPEDEYNSWYYLIYFEPARPSPGKIGRQERVGISVDLRGNPGFIQPVE